MSVTDIVTAAANGATAIGLIALATQVRQNAKEQRATFERSVVDRYQQVIQRIPFAEIVGRRTEPHLADDDIARAYFDYFELCEEELYYVRKRRISGDTLNDWLEGIALHLRRPAFQAAWHGLAEIVVTADPTGGAMRAKQFVYFGPVAASIISGDPPVRYRALALAKR